MEEDAVRRRPPSSIFHPPSSFQPLLPQLRAQQGELLLLDLALDDEGRADQDQQHELVLRGGAVGEEPLEERDLRQNRNAGLQLRLAGDSLTAEQEGAAVWDT